MCSFMVVTISFVLRTQNVHMFGYLILASVTLYMIIGRNMIGVPNKS